VKFALAVPAAETGAAAVKRTVLYAFVICSWTTVPAPGAGAIVTVIVPVCVF
jgi:hypothetical protein